jgi:hypothetical protein
MLAKSYLEGLGQAFPAGDGQVVWGAIDTVQSLDAPATSFLLVLPTIQRPLTALRIEDIHRQGGVVGSHENPNLIHDAKPLIQNWEWFLRLHLGWAKTDHWTPQLDIVRNELHALISHEISPDFFERDAGKFSPRWIGLNPRLSAPQKLFRSLRRYNYRSKARSCVVLVALIFKIHHMPLTLLPKFTPKRAHN